MTSYAVHGVWFLVAVLAALGWGRQVASRKETEFQERLAKVAPARPAAARSLPTPSAAPEETNPAAGSAADPEAVAEAKADKPAPAPLGPEEIRALLQSKNRKDAERGVRAIEKIADPALKLALLRDALGSPEERVRDRALEMLRKMGGPDAAALIAQALRTDPEHDIRRDAARYLGELGGPAAVAALQDAAQSGSLDLQVAAVGSLNKLGHPGPMHLVIQNLGRMLEDPDGALREDAVGHLDRLRTPAAIPALSRALRDSDSDIRRDAVDALEELKIPEVIPLLEGALQDPHPAVVRQATRALEKLRSPEAPK